jgi:hypothetical protein
VTFTPVQNRASERRWRADLHADLRAVTPRGVDRTPAAWVTAPAILGRLARALAPVVPEGRSTLLTCTEEDARIGVALSLATGLDAVGVSSGARDVGALRRGERVLLVAGIGSAPVREVAERVVAAGACELVGVLCVAWAGTAPDGVTVVTHLLEEPR